MLLFSKLDNSFDSFQNFESSSNFVASSSTPPPNQPQQKQQASADAILSLYNLPGMNAMNNQMGMVFVIVSVLLY
jgi:hypothetical protein